MWQDLRFFLVDFNYGLDALSTAMADLGYVRRKKSMKVKTSEPIRAARVRHYQLQLQLRPRPMDWIESPVGYADETWAANRSLGLQWITVHCIEDAGTFALLRQRGHRWMFWGIICSGRRGPYYIFKKGYGGMTVGSNLGV